MEDTILDDPKTPAHLFMWRAARNYFVGTPGSPEHQTIVQSYDDIDKENVAPISPVKSGRFSPAKRAGFDTAKTETPLKRKRSTHNTSIEMQGHAESQKQTQTQMQAQLAVSPTKSILRTPGAMTPRMKEKAGREMRVAFRSVSLSTNESPEVRRKNGNATTSKAQNQATFGILEDMTSTEGKTHDKAVTTHFTGAMSNTVTKPTSKPSVDSRAESKSATTAPPLADPPNTLDIFAEHDRRTATEMRRLIRHSQKWRDAAKRLDEENLKLKVILEEVGKENARLEGRLRMLGRRESEELRAGFVQKTQEGQVKATKVRESELAKRLEKVKGDDMVGAKTVARVQERRSVVMHDEEEVEEDAETRAMREIDELLDLTPPLDDYEAASRAHPAAAKTKTSESLRSISAPTAPSQRASHASTQLRPVVTSAELPRRPASTTLTSAPKTINESDPSKAAKSRSHQGERAPASETSTQVQYRTTPKLQPRAKNENNYDHARQIQNQIFNIHGPTNTRPTTLDKPTPTFPRPQTAAAQPSPLTALQHRIEGSILPASNTAERLGMPEDRVTEVRRRLAAKKRGSTGSSSAGAAQTGARREESAGKGRWLEKSGGNKFREESGLIGLGSVGGRDGESGVDWIDV
jgi:hypothetical protein